MHLRSRKRWRNRVMLDRPMVYYGRDHVPGLHEKSCGGIIKVQDLQLQYPNCMKGANILYLISSKLPDFAVQMVGYAKRKGVKLVVNQNGTAYPAWHGPGWEKTNNPMRQILELADYVIYQSEFCKKAADLHLVSRNSRYGILHNPVDTEKFTPSEVIPKGHKLISFGTHNQFYRVKCAVETVAILKNHYPDIHLTFAGQYHWRPDHEQAREELMVLVDQLDCREHVSISGRYSQNELVPMLQKHHVALHTKYNDPCPRLVAEAMACGLPVVYSKTGGVPELVGENGGIGIPAPLDWQKIHPPLAIDLASAVKKIFDHYQKYRSAARRQSVEKLDVRPWMSRHDIIFKELLK